MGRQVREHAAVAGVHVDLDVREVGAEHLDDGVAHAVDSLTRVGTDGHGARMMRLQYLEEGRILQAVDLIQHQQRWPGVAADLPQHRFHRLDMLLGVRIGCIDDVQQQPRLPRFLECRLE
jgi:hypothetical protein